jgi:hypothetical protein
MREAVQRSHPVVVDLPREAVLDCLRHVAASESDAVYRTRGASILREVLQDGTSQSLV